VSTARELVTSARALQLEAAYRTGDFAAVEALLYEALAAAAAEGDCRAEADAVDQVGLLAYRRAAQLPRDEQWSADVEQIRQLFERALAIRREIGDHRGVAESLFNIGRLLQVLRRDGDAASRLLEQALAMLQPANAPVLLGDIHLHIGAHVQHWGSGPGAAMPHYERTVELWRAHADPALLVVALVTLAWCELQAGRLNRAVEHAGEAVDLAHASGMRDRYVRRAEDALAAARSATAV
jgi:tetratricopeptide (TPR) repeat protein